MEETREVYVGNGETIQVKLNESVRYFLDIPKLEKYFNENPQGSLTVGATGDWYFTAREVKCKEDFDKILNGESYVLTSSDWSRFSINQEEDCTVEVPADLCELVARADFFKGIDKIEFWFPGIFHKCIKHMKYEELKAMVEEIKPIIEKYKKV